MEHWEIQELINTLEEADNELNDAKISAKIAELNELLSDKILSL